MWKRIIYDPGYKFPGTRLTVIENLPLKNGKSVVRCICDCDKNEWIGLANRIKTGGVKSCGCLKKEKVRETYTKHSTHRLTNHPLYSVCQMERQIPLF